MVYLSVLKTVMAARSWGFESSSHRQGSVFEHWYNTKMGYSDPDAQRKYQREWMAKRRAAYLADKTCVRCGTTKNLQIDHIDRMTKVTHRVWSWSEARRLAELAKCQVLCYPCHYTKSIECGDRPALRHGTHRMYNIYRCRCATCREGNRSRQAHYRAQRRTREQSEASSRGATGMTQPP